jgi:hypothetical protein
MARHKWQVGLFQFKAGIIKKACGGTLNDPDPEFLAADTGTVQVHKNCFDRFFKIDGIDVIQSGIAHRGPYIREGRAAKHDKLDFAIGGTEDMVYTVIADAKNAVSTSITGGKLSYIFNQAQTGNNERFHLIE